MKTETSIFWRLVARLLVRNGETTRMAAWLFGRALNNPYSQLEGYMGRWYVIQPPKRPEDPGYVAHGWRYWVDQLNILWPFYARLHLILRADLDRHLHDHPWWFRSIILTRWYDEETEDDHGRHVHRYWAGDINSKNSGQYHRIATVPDDGVLTLIIHGHRRKDSWGFKVNGIHVPWRKYLGLDK